MPGGVAGLNDLRNRHLQLEINAITVPESTIFPACIYRLLRSKLLPGLRAIVHGFDMIDVRM